MTKRPKALIIGGGIAGPVTAIFMKQAGLDAELFEAWPHSTGIERLWAVRHHMAAYRRVHAVGADHKVAFGAGAVGEMRDDRPVGAVFDRDQPFLET